MPVISSEIGPDNSVMAEQFLQVKSQIKTAKKQNSSGKAQALLPTPDMPTAARCFGPQSANI